MTCCLVIPAAGARTPAVAAAGCAAAGERSWALPDLTAPTSARTTRPCGPVPEIAETSIPASLASRRASGEANTRPLAPFASGNSSALPEALAAGMLRDSAGGAGGEKLPLAALPLAAAVTAWATFCRKAARSVSVLAAFSVSAAFCGGATGAGAPGAGAFTSAARAPSCSSTAITELTFTLSVPSGTMILPILPSSTASTSIVALSVSISAMTSPEETVAPSLTCHLASFPSSMVGESAGMVILMLIAASLADVFVPERWVLLDEVGHHVLAARVLAVFDLDSGKRQHVLETLEI